MTKTHLNLLIKTELADKFRMAAYKKYGNVKSGSKLFEYILEKYELENL